MSFDCNIREASPTTLEMQIAGNLDEHARFPADFDFSKATNLYIDFSLVNFINSGGIKVWVNFSEKLGAFGNLNVHLRKCNRVIIDQVNRTVGFLGPNAKVLSLYIPVFCNKCENSLQVFQEVPSAEIVQEQIFDKIEGCAYGPSRTSRTNWELDFIEEEFFKFLKSQ